MVKSISDNFNNKSGGGDQHHAEKRIPQAESLCEVHSRKEEHPVKNDYYKPYYNILPAGAFLTHNLPKKNKNKSFNSSFT